MPRPRWIRLWLLIGAVIVAVLASKLVIPLVFLSRSAVDTVCFHNSRSEEVTLSVDGAVMGAVAAGRSRCKSVVPGTHRLVARPYLLAAHGNQGVVEEGEFVVPPKKGPLSAFIGVFVLGEQPRLALVERCYGDCSGLPLNVVPFTPLGKFFPMPATVYEPLDAPFPERDLVKGRRKIRGHLCSLSAAGQPQCEIR
jgi:hypothetical protein